MYIDYISSRRLLLSLADAGGRLMYAYKDVLELAGLTTRLYSLFSTLHGLPPIPKAIESEDKIELRDVDIVLPRKRDFFAEYEMEQSYVNSNSSSNSSSRLGSFANGYVSLEDSGNFSRTPQPTLVHSLSFSLQAGSGEHLMITGTNGVGKTAVARVLAGLWAPGGYDRVLGGIEDNDTKGMIMRPARDVFIVPQRAYMVVGTLLDQCVAFFSGLLLIIYERICRIIYPHTYPQFLSSGRTEHELMHILSAVHLAYLPEREGGWTTRKEWRDVLSGGEKQRVCCLHPYPSIRVSNDLSYR